MSTSRFEKFMQKSGKNGIRNVALDYAYKGDTITFSVLSEKYGISKKVIQDCIEYAIVNCLIDYDEVILIKEKSHRNQAIHFRNTPVRTQSDRYYEDLLKRRLNYVKHLENMQVIEVAYLYIANPKMSCKELAKELHFSSKEVNLIIKNAIVNNLVEEGVIRHIYVVSLMKSGWKSVSSSVRQLLLVRSYEGTHQPDVLQQLHRNIRMKSLGFYPLLRPLQVGFGKSPSFEQSAPG